jgi:hypothetical protein
MKKRKSNMFTRKFAFDLSEEQTLRTVLAKEFANTGRPDDEYKTWVGEQVVAGLVDAYGQEVASYEEQLRQAKIKADKAKLDEVDQAAIREYVAEHGIATSND